MERHPLKIDFIYDLYNIWDGFHKTKNNNEQFQSFLKKYEPSSEFLPSKDLEKFFDISNEKLYLIWKNERYLIFAFSATDQLPFPYEKNTLGSKFYFALPLTNSQRLVYELVLASYGIYSKYFDDLVPNEVNDILCVIDNSVIEIADMVYLHDNENVSIRSISYINHLIEQKKDKGEPTLINYNNILLEKLNHNFRHEHFSLFSENPPNKLIIKYKPNDQKLFVPDKLELPLADSNNCTFSIVKFFLAHQLQVNPKCIEISDSETKSGNNENMELEYSICNAYSYLFMTLNAIYFTHIIPRNALRSELTSTILQYPYFHGDHLEFYWSSGNCINNHLDTPHYSNSSMKEENKMIIIISRPIKSPNILSDPKIFRRNLIKTVEIFPIFNPMKEKYEVNVPKTGYYSDIFILLRAKFGFMPSLTSLFTSFEEINPNDIINPDDLNAMKYQIIQQVNQKIKKTTQRLFIDSLPDCTYIVFKNCSDKEGEYFADFIINNTNTNSKRKFNFVPWDDVHLNNDNQSPNKQNKAFSFLSFENAQEDKQFVISSFEKLYGTLSEKERDQIDANYDKMNDPLDHQEMFELIQN